MPRLIFTHAELLDSSGSGTGDLIYGLVVESTEVTKEPQTVEIEDGRTLNEGFAGSITIRTVNTKFGQKNDGSDILGDALISSNGSPTSSKGGIKLHGQGSTPDLVMYPAYLMGHRDFSNGRVETVIMITASDTAQSIISRA